MHVCTCIPTHKSAPHHKNEKKKSLEVAEDATLQVLEARGKKAKKAVWVAGAAGATIGLLFGGPVGAALGMQLGAAVTGSAAVGAVLGAGVSAVTSGVTGGAIGGTLIYLRAATLLCLRASCGMLAILQCDAARLVSKSNLIFFGSPFLFSLSSLIVFNPSLSPGTIGAKIAKRMKRGVRNEIAADKEALLERKADRSNPGTGGES